MSTALLPENESAAFALASDDAVDHHDPDRDEAAAAGPSGGRLVAPDQRPSGGDADRRQLASPGRRQRSPGAKRAAAASGDGADPRALTIPAGEPWREPDHHPNGYPLPWRWQDADGRIWDSEELVEENLGLAHKIACEFHRSGRTALPLCDIEALCYLGLVRGCRKFNPRMPNPRVPGQFIRLSTRACPFIRGEVLHFVRDRGFMVRLPNSWREHWPRVRRLREDGLTGAQIEQLTGISVEDQDEMAANMGGCHDLNDEIHGGMADAPQIAEEDRLSPLLALVDAAWEELPASERRLLEAFWLGPKRVAFPHGSLQQLLRGVGVIRRGGGRRVVPKQLRLVMAVETAEVMGGKRQRREKREELEARCEQLGLLL